MDNAHSAVHHRSHWHWLFVRRRGSALKTERELLYSQLVALVGAIAAGLMLDLTKDTLASVAGVLMIVPGVFDLGGSIAGATAAKIHHRLEHDPTRESQIVLGSLLHALSLVLVAALVLGSIGGVLATLLFGGSWPLVLGITLTSVALSSAIGLPIVGVLTLLAMRRGVNPDNVIGPLEASLFDVLSILTVFAAVGWLA